MFYVDSHLVDQILWTMGDDPIEVYADETTTFQIQFAWSAVAQGMVMQTAHARLYSNLNIFGRQGRIGLYGVGFTNGVEVVSSALPAYSQPMSIQLPRMEDLCIQMHQPQLAEFAQALLDRPQPACMVIDGRRVLKVARCVHQVRARGSAGAGRAATNAAVDHGVTVTNGL